MAGGGGFASPGLFAHPVDDVLLGLAVDAGAGVVAADVSQFGGL